MIMLWRVVARKSITGWRMSCHALADLHAALRRGAPKGITKAIAAMPPTACRSARHPGLGASESGYNEWRDRPLSAWAVRHAWLTDRIRAAHLASLGSCATRRVFPS